MLLKFGLWGMFRNITVIEKGRGIGVCIRWCCNLLAETNKIPKPLEKSGKHHHDGASGSSPYLYELNSETEESYQNPNDYPC